MIPSETNPFGLEWKILTFHVLVNGVETGDPTNLTNLKYRYATFPKEYSEGWVLERPVDYESYAKLTKYVSREVTSGNRLMTTSNQDLWIWKSNLATVKFIAVEISYEGQKSIPIGEKLGTVPYKARTGYSLNGWFDGEVKAEENLIITNDHTFNAKWDLINYNIRYELKGKGDFDEPPPLRYTIEDEVELPNPISTTVGWEFDYWSPSNTITKESTGDKTFYSMWKPTQYHITYDMSGVGEVPEGAPTTYDCTSPSIFPPIPEPVEGHIFTGWNPEYIPEGSVGDKTFIANWNDDKIVVTFDSNDEHEEITVFFDSNNQET